MKGKRNSIFIEPHGDPSEELINMRFLHPEFMKNVIYADTDIKSVLGQEYSNLFCFNPLEINRKYVDTREKVETNAYNLSLAFEQIVDTVSSANMRATLIPCICVLLERDHSTLEDLERFLDDSRNDDLVALGRKSVNKAH